MEQFFEMFTMALMIAHLAVLYSRILSHEDVMNWWFRWGSQFEGKWFWKPIWGCHLCISGQIALWLYMANWIFASIWAGNMGRSYFIYKIIPIYQEWNYNALDLLIFVCLTIGISYLLNALYTKAEDLQ